MNKKELDALREKWEHGITPLHRVETDWYCLTLNERTYETAGSDYMVYRYFEVGEKIHISVDINTEDEREAWIKFVEMMRNME